MATKPTQPHEPNEPTSTLQGDVLSDADFLAVAKALHAIGLDSGAPTYLNPWSEEPSALVMAVLDYIHEANGTACVAA